MSFLNQVALHEIKSIKPKIPLKAELPKEAKVSTSALPPPGPRRNLKE
jgi:hypothetical protein